MFKKVKTSQGRLSLTRVCEPQRGSHPLRSFTSKSCFRGRWLLGLASIVYSRLYFGFPGDPRPPFVNRIVRVNRGPSIPSSIEEEASLFLKSPAYQLRFRPHRLSQFHGYPVLNGQIPNSNGLSIFNMPGIASHHAPTMALNNNSPQLPAIQESAEVAELVDNQQPTFTPFISAS